MNAVASPEKLSRRLNRAAFSLALALSGSYLIRGGGLNLYDDRTASWVTVSAMTGSTKGTDSDNSTGTLTSTRTKTKKPSMYRVLLLNDDYTPMEFVILVLERFFSHSREQATRIMLHVHQKGIGICGVYTYEIAETKVAQVTEFARRHEHPLQCTMEKE